MSSETAIILAAGMGRRLGITYPKCLLEIDGKSILRRQIEAFLATGVETLVIVVGFQEEEIRRHVAHHRSSLGSFQCRFVRNDRYADTNTSYSLYLVRETLPEGVFYANADVVFDHRLPERLQLQDAPSALAVKRMTCGAEEVKVEADGDRVRRIGKSLEPEGCMGEFIGVARFGSAIGVGLAGELERLIEHEQVAGAYFEDALDSLCPASPLTIVDVTDLPCCEIDFPVDLEHARREIAPHLQTASR
jgi:choline kinase